MNSTDLLAGQATGMIGLIPVMLDTFPDNDRRFQRSLSYKTKRSG